MGKFFKRIICLLGLVFFIIALIYFISDQLMKKQEQKFFKLNKEKHILFAGDSNIECDVNDSLIHNAVNIAQSGEAYMYTFYKIRTLLNFNNQIDTICLGYAFHDIELNTEKRWMFKDEIVIEKMRSFNYLTDFEADFIIFKNNPKAFLLGIRDCSIFNINTLLKSHFHDNYSIRNLEFGGYLYLKRDKLKDDINIYSKEKHNYEEGYYQIEYLRKIVQLCQQRSVKLILINTPKHKFYINNLNKNLIKNWELISKSFTNMTIKDFSNLALPDSCFGDLTHLNYRGARLFSEYLNREIRK